MVRRVSSDNLQALRAPLIAAVFAAGLMPPVTIRAGDAPDTPSRSVVALKAAPDDVAMFLQFLTASGAEDTSVRGMVRRALGVPKSAVPQSSTAVSDKPLSPMRQLVVADADPFFERWQKDANEKLKEEAVIRTVKQHALALANPDKMVVVCEAGCRTPKDEIVYIAAAVPAVEPPRTFDPSSSEKSQPVDEGNLPCIAGCYEKPERNKPAAPRRSAEIRDVAPPAVTTPVQHASLNVAATLAPVARVNAPLKVRNRQIGQSGAIVDERIAATAKYRQASHSLKNKKVTGLRAWRTKVIPVHAVPAQMPPAKINRAADWTTTIVKSSPVLKRVKATGRIRHATRPNPIGVWQTRITFEGEARNIVRH